MKLTDLTIKALKHGPAPQIVKAGDGLTLRLGKADADGGGTKSWQHRFRLNGRTSIATLGQYPEVGLAEARRRLAQVKAQLAQGLNPNVAPPPAVPQITLRAAWAEFYQVEMLTGRWAGSPDVARSLERDVLSVLGEQPVAAITAALLLDKVLMPVVRRGAVETAHRLQQRLEWLFDYAASPAKGWCSGNPAHGLKKNLPKMRQHSRNAAAATLAEARTILAGVEAQVAFPVSKLAHRFTALTAGRQGAVVHATWDQFEGLDAKGAMDATGAIWHVPGKWMKGKNAPDFDIPLCHQAVEVLQAARTLGGKHYVFPSVWHAKQPITTNTVGKLLRDAGFLGQQTAHGWRAAFSTVMNDRHPELKAVIDFALAHIDRASSKVERAYNRALYIDTRRKLHQEWADALLADFPPASALLQGPKRLMPQAVASAVDHGAPEPAAPSV